MPRIFMRKIPPALKQQVRLTLSSHAEKKKDKFEKFDIIPTLKKDQVLEKLTLTPEAVATYIYSTVINEVVREEKRKSSSGRSGFLNAERLVILGENEVSKLKHCTKALVMKAFNLDKDEHTAQVAAWGRKEVYYEYLLKMWDGYSSRTTYQEILSRRKKR